MSGADLVEVFGSRDVTDDVAFPEHRLDESVQILIGRLIRAFLETIGYACVDETDNPAYRLFAGGNERRG